MSALATVPFTAEAPAFHRLFLSERALLGTTAGVLLSYVLEGPLRLALVLVRLEMILYARDAVMLALVIWFTVSRQRNTPLLGLLALLLCHFLIGLLSLPSLAQALMGAKVYVPLAYGVAMAPVLRRHPASVARFARFTLLITVLGVFGNVYIAYPWIGMSYETAMGAVELSRSWSSEGVSRIPGFARASFTAAGIILLSLAPALTITSSRLLRACLVLASGTAIAVTTTKGAWTGLAAIAILEVLWRVGRSWLWGSGASIIAMTSLLLPLVTTQLYLNTAHAATWQLSFVERIKDMWPRALKLFADPLQVVWGRGLGGIGVAQRLGEPTVYNAADNLMLYLLLTFGALGVVYAGAFVGAVARYSGENARGSMTAWLRAWLGIWLAGGLTTNMVEDIGIEVVIGLTVGMAFAPRMTQQSEAYA